MLNISYLCTRLTHIGVQWCNGSTTGLLVSNGVMVAQQVLVLFVVVRIRLGQR